MSTPKKPKTSGTPNSYTTQIPEASYKPNGMSYTSQPYRVQYSKDNR
jgi:hypothetical protein